MSILLAKESPFLGWQGEGSTQGKNSLFIRYVGCNLCCTDCDTPYAWKAGSIESKKWEFKELINEIRKYNTNHIVFTGGEPVCLATNFNHSLELMRALESYVYTCEYETNGVVAKNQINNVKSKIQYCLPSRDRIQFNISPKFNFKQDREVNTDPTLIDILQYIDYKNYIVKFLFDCEEDLTEIEQFQKNHNISKKRIWVQPKGIDSDTLKNVIVEHYDRIINNGWNVSMRSHIFLFGNKKGV